MKNLFLSLCFLAMALAMALSTTIQTTLTTTATTTVASSTSTSGAATSSDVCAPLDTCSPPCISGRCVGSSGVFWCTKTDVPVLKNVMFKKLPGATILMAFQLFDSADQPVASFGSCDAQVLDGTQGNELPAPAKQTTVQAISTTVGFGQTTLMIIDASGEVLKTPTFFAELQAAAANFSRDASPSHHIALAAYDGRTELLPLCEFTSDPARLLERIANLRAILDALGSDPSTNLFGAIIQAVSIVNARVAKDTRPVKQGNAIILSSGNDQAGHKSQADAIAAISRATFVRVMAVCTVPVPDLSFLKPVVTGQGGKSLAGIFVGFKNEMIKRASNWFQLVYCTAKRAGTQRVLLKFTKFDSQPAVVMGSFNATSVYECDLNAVQSFCAENGVRQCGFKGSINCGACPLVMGSSATVPLENLASKPPAYTIPASETDQVVDIIGPPSLIAVVMTMNDSVVLNEILVTSPKTVPLPGGCPVTIELFSATNLIRSALTRNALRGTESVTIAVRSALILEAATAPLTTPVVNMTGTGQVIPLTPDSGARAVHSAVLTVATVLLTILHAVWF